MNQKEQMEIYELKNMLLERVCIVSENLEQYEKIKKAISEAVEEFIHDETYTRNK